MSAKLRLIDTDTSRREALRARVRDGAYAVDVRALALAMLRDTPTRARLGLDLDRAGPRRVSLGP
jgi:hypothetical protein